MYAILAAVILSQFAPGEIEEVTLEKYAKGAQTAKAEAAKGLRKEVQKKWGILGNSAPTPQQRREMKMDYAEVDVYLEDKTIFHDVPLYETKLSLGSVGVITRPHPSVDGKLTPTIAKIEHVVPGDGFRTTLGNVKDGGGGSPIFIKMDTAVLKDKATIELKDVMVVRGKYYPPEEKSAGIKKGMLYLEVWEHNGKWQRKAKAQKKPAAKAKK